MHRLSEQLWQHELTDFADTRRPRRSRFASLHFSRPISGIYERGVSGGTARARRKSVRESSGEEPRVSIFPAIIKDRNVSYDPQSQLFTISGLSESKGEAYYFEDLPYEIKAEILRLRRSQPKT